MREIVTVQVGGFANYIGSHFWNFQDELLGLAEQPNGDAMYSNSCMDMDILYRSGETQQGFLTYTPRLVSVGFQGSLGSLHSSGSLYGEVPSSDPSDVITWAGKVSRHEAEPNNKNLFQQSLYDQEESSASLVAETHDTSCPIQDKDLVESLENDVQFWTDFSKVHYHPRSLYEFNGSWIDVNDFDHYGMGRSALSATSQVEEMIERLRFFVEECNRIQGIQFIVDDSGGFSSVAAEYLESIADEYTKTPVLLYAVRGPDSRMKVLGKKKSILRSLHDAVSFSRLSSFCKLIVPAGLPSLGRSKASEYLCVDDAKPFHSSAVYAAALHSSTLPFRMQLSGPSDDSNYVSGAVDINLLTHMLADQARQNMVAILDAAMPLPSLAGTQLKRSFLQSLYSLTPDVAEDADDEQAVELMTIHGAFYSGNRRALLSEVKDSVHCSHQNNATIPMFSHLAVAPCPLHIPLPFPSIFRNIIGEQGEILAGPVSGTQSKGSLDIKSVPMAARLRSSSAISPFIKRRLEDLRRYGIQRGAVGMDLARSWGFQKEDLEEMGETLTKMVMALHPHESSDSE